MGEGLKELFVHKISIRLIYLVSAFGTSRFISLVASQDAQDFFNKAGISFQITDPEAFKMWVQLSLMALGEFVFHFFHTKFVLPKVNKNASTLPTNGN